MRSYEMTLAEDFAAWTNLPKYRNHEIEAIELYFP